MTELLECGWNEQLFGHIFFSHLAAMSSALRLYGYEEMNNFKTGLKMHSTEREKESTNV